MSKAPGAYGSRRVFLTTLTKEDWSRAMIDLVTEVARADRVGVHSLAPDAQSADLIVFVDPHQHLSDWRMRELARHPLVRTRPRDVFVYDERDRPRDLLPGAYVAMPIRRFDRRRHRAVGYCGLKTDTRMLRAAEPDLLFSFQGRRSCAARARVLDLHHARAVIEDTSGHDFFVDSGAASERAERYLDVLGRSKFVLCPRGHGSATYRLFEVMAAGRVPVIVSDEWVEPSGVAWETCSIRIAERRVAAIPAALELAEDSWQAMGSAAAAAFDEWFAPEVWFHGLVESCCEIAAGGDLGPAPQLSQPAYWRDGLRALLARLPERG